MDRRGFSRRLLSAVRASAFPGGGYRVVPARPLVREGARSAMPRARLLHSRGDRRIRQQESGDEVLRPEGEQGALLRRRLGLGNDSRGVLVHGAPSFRRHLHARGGPRACDRLSLFGAGDQRSGHRSDGPRSRVRARHRPRGGSNSLQRHHRASDAPDIPEGGEGESGGRRGCVHGG